MNIITLSSHSLNSWQEDQSFKKFEIEEQLEPILKEIDEKKKISSREFVWLTGHAFLQKAHESPRNTAIKCAFLILAIGTFYPVGIGSLACLNSYRVDDLNHIFSSDLEKASIAVQIFSNLGQGIAYFAQDFELLLIPYIGWAFKDLHNKVICQRITDVYTNKIQNSLLSSEEINFLTKRANKELIRRGGFSINKNEHESIFQKIEKEIKQSFSKRNIIHLIGCEIIKEAKAASWTKIFTKTTASIALFALTAAPLHPLYYGTIACFAAFRVESPIELNSSDKDTMLNATALYSNLGHVVEYVAIGCALTGLTAKVLLGDKYKKIACQLIETIYNKYIQDSSLLPATRELIYKQKQKKIINYQ